MKKYSRAIVVLCIGAGLLIYPLIAKGFTSFAHWLPTTNHCLLGLSSGSCGYNPSSGWATFSLGEAVAALGLFLAVIQLADPLKKLTLKINKKLRLVGFLLLGVGFLSILIASVVPHTPVNYKVFSFPIFWEIIGYFCFIGAPSVYYYASSKKGRLFKPKLKAAQHFYDEMLDALAKDQPGYREAVAEILVTNADELLSAIKKLTPYESRFSFDGKEMPPELEYAKYASDLVEIVLSERKVANILATQRIDYLFDLLALIKKHRLTTRAIRNGVDRIFEELYEDRNSHLYKQLERGGLTLYAPLYDVLFGDREMFFVSQLYALNAWNRYGVSDEVKFSEGYVKVYLHALEQAVKAYGFRGASPVEGLAGAIEELPEYGDSLAMLDDNYERGKLSVNTKIMMDLVRFLGNTFPNTYKDAIEAGTATDYELNATAAQNYRGSLTASYAEAVAEFLQAFSIQGKDDEAVWLHVHGLTTNVLDIFDDGGRYANIRARFFEKIWKKIKENVEQGFYPVVIRYYIQIFNFEGAEQPQWRKDERNRLYAYMKTELAPRLVKGELMRNGDLKEKRLLPDSITFNKRTKRFYRANSKKAIVWELK
jgi:hypothetical protein